MTETPKFCINCKHHCTVEILDGCSPIAHYCKLYERSELDLVTGQTTEYAAYCETLRKDPTKCSINAIHFEPKD